MSFSRWPLALLAMFFLLTSLASCGGGGGGNGGTSYSVSPTNITFTASDSTASAPPPQTVTVTANSGTILLGSPQVSGTGVSSADLSITSTTTATVTIYPASPANLGTGTYKATVSIPACADSNCSSQISGSPKNVSVTYNIAGFSASPTSVSMTSVEGATPAAVALNFSHSSGSVSWTASVAYVGTTTGWLSLSKSSGGSTPATINVNASPLTAGTYSATITLTGGGSTLHVPVTYTTTKALAPSPASLSYTIGNTPTAADLSQVMTIGSNYASPSPTLAWSASTADAWLSLSPASGDTASQNQLTASLVQAQTDTLLNGTYHGTVTLDSSTAYVSPVTVPVNLTINRTQVNYVAPYVAMSNTASDVIIRGQHFSQISVQGIDFGGNSASSFSVISDTEIHATAPALPVGQYPVNLVTSTGSYASRATLVVVAPSNLTDMTFADTSTVYKYIVPDPERNAILAYPSGGATLERHVYNGSSWSTTTATLPYSIYGAALSPDGKELVIRTSDNRLAIIDPVTLSVISATDPQTTYPSNLTSILVTNDGKVLLGTGGSTASQFYRYNLLDNTITPLANSTVNMSLSTSAVSGDGSKAILNYSNYFTGADNVYTYDAGTGAFTAIPIAMSAGLFGISRTGSLSLWSDSGVYDPSMSLLGKLPFYNGGTNANCTTSEAVISPDGTRGYTYCFSGSGGRIYTYDLTAAPVGGLYPAIGSYVSAPNLVNALVVSHDGKQLFVVDTSKVTVINLP